MMALTKDDREVVELIAERVGARIAKELVASRAQAISQMISYHQDTYPHGQRWMESRWMIAGAAATVLALSAGGNTIAQIVLKLAAGI